MGGATADGGAERARVDPRVSILRTLERARDYQDLQGTRCDAVDLRIDLKADDDDARVISLRLLKIDAGRLTGVIGETGA